MTSVTKQTLQVVNKWQHHHGLYIYRYLLLKEIKKLHRSHKNKTSSGEIKGKVPNQTQEITDNVKIV